MKNTLHFLGILGGLLLGLWQGTASADLAAPYLHLSDSINPGSADYITHAIEEADREKAPYLVIQLDTPGGLLTSTRKIVQGMLNAKTPVIVYIAPAGAHAGSAGALITFASDIAAMAPGTNIGAAHPVTGTSEKMDKVMEDKITNDTAGFAESLARAKGRNPEWAVKSVRKSEVLSADAALKDSVIDLIVDSPTELAKRLAGLTLHAPKQGLTSLPKEIATFKPVPMSIKQRLVSFFADPNLAYLIMTLGGLCIWIELTHPGLVLPGLLGAVCIIVSLISFQMLPIHYGALALILGGMGLLIAELYLPTFGVVGFTGILCFILGSLFLMDTNVPEFQISMSLIFPTAAVVTAFAFALGLLVMRSRRSKHRTGIEALVGQFCEIRELVSEKPGKVFLHGELWNAVTTSGEPIERGEVAVVREVRDMLLVVAPHHRHTSHATHAHSTTEQTSPAPNAGPGQDKEPS